MRRTILLGLLLCGIAALGCSKSAETSPAASEPQAQAAATGAVKQGQPVAVPANATPDKVVGVFLDSLRSGDQPTTASLLTAKALTETSKRNLSVCPQATPQMQYTIKAAEVLADNPNGAHVSVEWLEKYSDGEIRYEVVWVLRRQQEGWRVAGMAIELVPGQGLAFLNFEDPDDMLRKQEEAMLALNPPAAETAALPVEGEAASTENQPLPNQNPPSQNFQESAPASAIER